MKASQMDDGELVTAIMSELNRAVDYANTSLQEIRKNSWDYYLNRPRGDEMPGRSQVQDTSVRDTVHALHATIMPTFDTPHLIDFPPRGQGDEDQADAEARTVNDILRAGETRQELSRAFKDAEMFRNAVGKVWHETVQEAVIRRWPDEVAAEAEVGLIEQFGEDNVENLGSENGLTSIRVTTEQQEVKVRTIEPAYFYVDPNHSKPTLQDCRFMSERWIATRSELVELGVPRETVDALPFLTDEGITSGVGQSNTDIMAKFIDQQSDIGDSSTHDQQNVECFWVHMFIDMDGDGISERWRFLMSNYQLLEKTPVSFFPYASGCIIEVPHRWSGLSIYDVLRITQDERTNARRQLADNLNFANNQRPVASPDEVSWDDLLAGAPGRPIRRKKAGPPVEWMPFTDVTSNSIAFLGYMDTVRSEQAGAALDMMSADQQNLKSISGLSAEMQLSPSEMAAADYSRTFANTYINQLVLLIHRTLREQWQGPLMFNKAGEWQETNPAQWPARDRVNITVALSPGERRRQSAHYMQQYQMQEALIAGGAANIAVTWAGMHKTIYDWQTSVGIDPTEGYFLDPDSQQSQQGQQAAAQQAEMTSQQQAQAIERGEAREDFKAQDDSNKWQENLRLDYAKLNQESEIEEAKLVEQGIQARIGSAANATEGAAGGDAASGQAGG